METGPSEDLIERVQSGVVQGPAMQLLNGFPPHQKASLLPLRKRGFRVAKPSIPAGAHHDKDASDDIGVARIF